MPDCLPLDTRQPCAHVKTSASHAAALTLDGWQHFWTRHPGTRIVARGRDTDDVMGTEPMDEWEYDTASAVTHTLGFDRPQASPRRAAASRSGSATPPRGRHLVPEHPEALHTGPLCAPGKGVHAAGSLGRSIGRCGALRPKWNLIEGDEGSDSYRALICYGLGTTFPSAVPLAWGLRIESDESPRPIP